MLSSAYKIKIQPLLRSYRLTDRLTPYRFVLPTVMSCDIYLFIPSLQKVSLFLFSKCRGSGILVMAARVGEGWGDFVTFKWRMRSGRAIESFPISYAYIQIANTGVCVSSCKLYLCVCKLFKFLRQTSRFHIFLVRFFFIVRE